MVHGMWSRGDSGNTLTFCHRDLNFHVLVIWGKRAGDRLRALALQLSLSCFSRVSSSESSEASGIKRKQKSELATSLLMDVNLRHELVINWKETEQQWQNLLNRGFSF